MNINPINHNNTVFNAHKYGLIPAFKDIIVKTDKNSNMGRVPYLITKDCWSDKIFASKMSEAKDEFISTSVSALDKSFSYYIKYKDTKKNDKQDGKKYNLPIEAMFSKATEFLRKLYKQPLVKTIKNGSTAGKLLYKKEFTIDDLKGLKEPTILLTPSIPLIVFDNNNLVGLVSYSEDIGALEHMSANLRNNTDVACCLFDKDKIEELKKLDGKNIELNVDNGSIEYKLTSKKANLKTYPKIDVPKLKYSNKVLTSKEYSLDLVGAKAVNLRRLENLVEGNKIDVIIPKSMTITYGYIQELFDENELQKVNYDKHKDLYVVKEGVYAPYRKSYAEERMKNLLKLLKSEGIDSKFIAVRSAFNGEDLSGYSAAGLYDSTLVFISSDLSLYYDLYMSIVRVAQSKWKDGAIKSREKYQINDADIQPSVILQNFVDSDYNFTLYTEYDKDKLRLELYNRQDNIKAVLPHVFTYDKKNHELSYDSILMNCPVAWYDENLEPIPNQKPENDLSENTEVLKLVNKLIDNALVIEKEFGYPQDIEGGFKDNDIYLWQTRNIVK